MTEVDISEPMDITKEANESFFVEDIPNPSEVQVGDVTIKTDNLADLSMENVYGGESKSTDVLFRYVLIGMLVLFILYLLYNIATLFKYNGEDYFQRKTHMNFDNIHGEAFDEEAKNAILYGERIPNPRAIDHYRLGSVYLVNAHDPRRAHHHFRQALNQIINGYVDPREAPFIINRIDDFKDHFMDFPDIDELPLQTALLEFYDQNRKQVSRAANAKEPIAKEDPEFRQKVILSRQAWESDSQNVHDKTMYDILHEQYNLVRAENMNIKNLGLHDYKEAVTWIRTRFIGDPTNTKKVDMVIRLLNQNASVSNIPNTREQDILVVVWQRSYHPKNKDNASEIKEAIANAILDCVEGESVVCPTGRTMKIWQSLSRLDFNPDIGVFKTKQSIRNEIYERCAKIIDDYVGKHGTASDILKKSYLSGEDNEQVKELVETIKNQIDSIRTEYIGIVDDRQLDVIIDECKAIL
jgi:hypothetical protein